MSGKKNPKKSKAVAKTVKNEDFNKFISKKTEQVIDIIQRTYLSLDFCKQYDIFTKSSIGQCMDHLQTIYSTCLSIKQSMPIEDSETDATISIIQSIFDKLSVIFSTHGTFSINDIFFVVFGTKYNKYDHYDENNGYVKGKMHIIENYMIPTNYKNLTWFEPEESEQCSEVNKITDFTIQVEKHTHMECFEPMGSYCSLHQCVYGIRIIIRNSKEKKMISISGILRDIPNQYLLDNQFISVRLKEIKDHILSLESDCDLIDRWVHTISVKELLIYSKHDFYKKFSTMSKDVKYVLTNRVDNIVKKFFEMDLLSRRKMLVNLFTYNTNNEVQYIAYMLYDLIGSSDGLDGVDNNEQVLLYESLPWKLKQYFKETMIHTIEFTQDSLSTCDVSKVSLEQQVLLMKVSDKVKDKAMIKLKEVKNKSDDQGNKSKQYLEGLVRVPFGMFRKEPVLCKMELLNEMFMKAKSTLSIAIEPKVKYTLHEIKQALIPGQTLLMKDCIDECRKKVTKCNKGDLVKCLQIIDKNTEYKTRNDIIHQVQEYFHSSLSSTSLQQVMKLSKIINNSESSRKIGELCRITGEVETIENTLTDINGFLDDSIYGHDRVKQQILKIVGQWINGEQKGYCFGFEGSPGVGKTSLAKHGLAKCLQDDNGVSRPFSFIALGGSSNGSTLEGHNYTYVNSTWGKIVDVLMESKCMNPIIYIDELDKVSKTEQGREIIGILTHMIDTTQNDEFQDRYFSGIPFDLSKALFIFSYNDPEQIDRILLDRIHRIRFDNLSWSDKIVIVNKFIMPELNKKMGFENTVEMSDDVIKHIIETYTMEPGVRKLKELLFDLFGEINLQLLNYSKTEDSLTLPLKIKVEDLGTTYFKKQRKVSDVKIHTNPLAGVINGMWANALGKGGIIPIEASYFPSTTCLDFKLTGMQGDVMKESMTVAKTLAWSLTPEKRQKELLETFTETKNQGLHVHCPEGAVSKDGPSAGGAITLSIFSLLNNKQIQNTVSMTGEINLRGKITAIGGLDTKIIGSMKAGVKKVLYPKENQDDFDDFLEKYGNVIDLDEMSFHPVSSIEEAMELVFV